MIEENGTTHRAEYARKVRIYHQMKALVSLQTTPPPPPPTSMLTRRGVSRGWVNVTHTYERINAVNIPKALWFVRLVELIIHVILYGMH